MEFNRTKSKRRIKGNEYGKKGPIGSQSRSADGIKHSNASLAPLGSPKILNIL